MLPAGWREASHRLDEIWTYSAFAAQLIDEGVEAPVRSVPLPAWGEPTHRGRASGLPEGFACW